MILANTGLSPKSGSVEIPNALDLYMWKYEKENWWNVTKKWVQKDKLATFNPERDADGVYSRNSQKRVRCIYNPNPPKQIIVSGSGDDIQYEYKY